MLKTIKINLKDKIVILTVDDESAIDTEDLLRIDRFNIAAELMTFAVWMNRVGILKAQADDAVRARKFECDIYEADMSEVFRKSLSTTEVGKGGVKKVKAPVLDAVKNAVLLDEEYQKKMKEYYRAKRNADYIDSLYWSIKFKGDNLKALNSHVPEDFEVELVENVINGIKIKGLDKPFKSGRRN